MSLDPYKRKRCRSRASTAFFVYRLPVDMDQTQDLDSSPADQFLLQKLLHKFERSGKCSSNSYILSAYVLTN